MIVQVLLLYVADNEHIAVFLSSCGDIYWDVRIRVCLVAAPTLLSFCPSDLLERSGKRYCDVSMIFESGKINLKKGGVY